MKTKEIAEKSAGGIGITSLLGLAFVVLKLCGVIDWSWWWVTSPFWLPLVAVLSTIAAVLLIVGVVLFFVWLCARKGG